MSTRTLRFFMRLDEFSGITWQIAHHLHLHVILVRMGVHIGLGTRPERLDMEDGRPADRVFFARQKPDLQIVDPRHLHPGKWGWVDAEIPREEDLTLLMSSIGAKSNWYDTELHAILENAESLHLFRAIAPSFRKHLHRPVWVSNVLGDTPQPYQNLGYSDGAAQWVAEGGVLRQSGVANIRYHIKPPAI
jgi:hypothetical protein